MPSPPDLARAAAQAARRLSRDPERAATLARLARGAGHFGWCPICERAVVFVKLSDWLRDDYHCLRCWSIPRQRALVDVLADEVPDWRERRIHESSPAGAGSEKLARECAGYEPSHYWPDLAPGELRDGVRCEDLTRLTLADASVDVVITQDVFEHVLGPEAAFAEIARVLRPGGAHVFTVPWYRDRPTLVRAELAGGAVVHHEPPDYHGNPIDANGSLVVTEWGRELPAVIARASGLTTTVHTIRDRRKGIDGPFREVFVSRRP